MRLLAHHIYDRAESLIFLRDHEGECVVNLDFTGSTLFLVLLLFAAGLVCIIKGGDIFVDAATWIAEASGIPKFIILSLINT